MTSLEIMKNVKSASFSWDMDRGIMKFEQEPVVLFWVDTALKTFLDTVEEVAGPESVKVVLEAAGYRTGLTVSEFYASRTESLCEMIELLPDIYRAAGWGSMNIINFDFDKKEARIQVKDDWEDRINLLNKKEEPGTFLAAHWAGVLTGLLSENIWFDIIKHPTFGDEYSEFVYAPSKITPAENIRSLLNEQEKMEIARLEAQVEDRTRELQSLIKDLSSPIIPVLENIVVIPMMGQFDETRANELMEKTLNGVASSQSNIIIFDVTGMNELEGYTITMLENITQAVTLIGAIPVVAGMSPDLSMKLVSNGVYLHNLKCFQTLKHAIHYALALEGMELVQKK